MRVYKITIFWYLCTHYCSIMDGWVPYPSTLLHRHLPQLSTYKLKKYLKELKEEGWITSDMFIEQGEEHPWIIRGYTITDKARNTFIYKSCHERERRLCNKVFDFDIGPVRTEKKYKGDEFDEYCNS